MLAHRFCEPSSVILLGDHPLTETILLHQRGCEAIVPITAAALPIEGRRNAAGICTVDDLVQSGHYVGGAVLAELGHDPPSPHFVGHSAGRSGACKGVKDEIPRICRQFQDAPDELFRLRSIKGVFWISRFNLFASLMVMTNLAMKPNGRCRWS